MRSNNITSKSQGPRVLRHDGPFDTPAWIAYAAMAVCQNNGIPVVRLKRGVRVPIGASVVIVTDDAPSSALAELQDCEPTWTLFPKPPTISDYMPALISTVINNRHAAIVSTVRSRLDHWRAVAGGDLIHVAVDNPVAFFGDVIGGAE